VYSSKFVFHVVELRKLEETPEEARDELYCWARLIAAKSWEAVCMEAKGNPYMEEARAEMDRINQNEQERYLYLRRAMAISDEKSRMKTARNEGLREGNIKGMVETYKECGVSKDETSRRLQEKLSMSKDEAKEYTEIYW
jgi:predicted transposase/invertase (TIGR01784 family)